MKTIMEQEFEKRVLYYICTQDIPLERRLLLLQDFHINIDNYYDGLCDILYNASKGLLDSSSIWITQSGQFYVLSEKKESNDLYLCPCSEIPPFRGDLAVQLEHIYLCIYHNILRMYQKMIHRINY